MPAVAMEMIIPSRYQEMLAAGRLLTVQLYWNGLGEAIVSFPDTLTRVTIGVSEMTNYDNVQYM